MEARDEAHKDDQNSEWDQAHGPGLISGKAPHKPEGDQRLLNFLEQWIDKNIHLGSSPEDLSRSLMKNAELSGISPKDIETAVGNVELYLLTHPKRS